MSSTSRTQSLLAQLGRADPGAKAAILEYTLDRIRRQASRMLRGRPGLQWEQTDDVLQKAIMRLHATLDKITPESSAAFFAITAKQIRWVLGDLARAVKRNVLHRAQSLEENDTPAREVDAVGQWLELNDLIDGLPEEERQVVDLVFTHELSQEEAALELKVSLRTLKRRWRSAKLLLISKLEAIDANHAGDPSR